MPDSYIENIFIAVLVAAAAAAAQTTTEFSLNQSNRESRVCTLESGREGICVNYFQCYDNHTINPYGEIDDNEIRLVNCPGNHYWCCEQDAPPLPDAACPVAAGCPWCVTLHRLGGSPRTRAVDGRQCGGVLVAGGGAVLTAASCVRAAARQGGGWTQRGTHNYTQRAAVTHRDYSSGTREHDLAVMALSSVAGPPGCLPPPTAPTAPATPAADVPPSNCLAVGYETDGTLVMTEVEVVSGLCGERGGTAGALCARPRGGAGAGACRVLLGAPLLCERAAGGGWVVWGVSRGGGCGAGGAQYSSVAADRDWLSTVLPDPSATAAPAAPAGTGIKQSLV